MSEEKIRRNIEYTKMEHEKGNVNKSVTGYLVDAIKNALVKKGKMDLQCLSGRYAFS